MLQQAERSGDAEVLDAVERTLRSGLSGGIHDHIEGGFHRYAIDPGWRVPHFEKMLNDQALNTEVYLTAYRLTGEPEYATTARKTIDYVLADLTSPEGGFFTARSQRAAGLTSRRERTQNHPSAHVANTKTQRHEDRPPAQGD